MSQLTFTRLLPVAIAPIIQDGDIDLKGLYAIVLRNAGTATVNLWNGLYTLDPKETLSVNVTENGYTLDIQNVSVTFDTSTGVIKKLQILTLKANPNAC